MTKYLFYLLEATALNNINGFIIKNRSDGIWTHDPHYPKVVRYQAALRPANLNYHMALEN